MKLKNILLATSMVLGGLMANAQTTEVTEYEFHPHFYVQGQFGAQYTLGETSFGKLISPNAQLGLGYNFSPVLGARFSVNAWQSKGSFDFRNNLNLYQWNYVAPSVAVTTDLTHLIGGYQPERLVSVGLLAGLGANLGFNNDQAGAVKQELVNNNLGDYGMRLYWDKFSPRVMGQFGTNVDFRITDRLSVGLEISANVVPDAYNSKKANNADWYFNALAGVKFALGKTYTKTVKTIAPPEPIVKIVHDTIYVDRFIEKVEQETGAKVIEPMRRDVFFRISNAQVSNAEKAKVDEVAKFMMEHPETKVVITGFADKGTGPLEFNLNLSQKRAQSVANLLIREYNIPEDRIIVKSMDANLEQPHSEPLKNRVAICLVK